jgi:hypothetical protein
VSEKEIIPVCQGCHREAGELDEYDEFIEDRPVTAEARREAVKSEEGTYNPENGHFLCTPCYIVAGMPSSSGGWRCP